MQLLFTNSSFKVTTEIMSVCNNLYDRKEGIILETQFIKSLYNMPVVSMETDTLSNGKQTPVLFYRTNGNHLELPSSYGVTENKCRHVLMNCLNGLLTISADYDY